MDLPIDRVRQTVMELRSTLAVDALPADQAAIDSAKLPANDRAHATTPQ